MIDLAIITWAQAVSKLVIGSALLYILYGAFTNMFETTVEMIFYNIDPSVIDAGSRTLFITFIVAELILIFYVFYAAVRVEFDRYVEY